jgi:hypothetical protein
MRKEQWDVQWCRPKVTRYLEVQRHPNAVYMDWLETWLGRYCKVPHIIKTPRLRFCISQCLRDEGYHRVSKNGKRWEMTLPETDKARDDLACSRPRSGESSTTNGPV